MVSREISELERAVHRARWTDNFLIFTKKIRLRFPELLLNVNSSSCSTTKSLQFFTTKNRQSVKEFVHGLDEMVKNKIGVFLPCRKINVSELDQETYIFRLFKLKEKQPRAQRGFRVVGGWTKEELKGGVKSWYIVANFD